MTLDEFFWRAALALLVSGALTLVVLPMLGRLAHHSYEHFRYPRKSDRLTRIMNNLTRLCEDNPAVLESPEFVPAVTEIVRQLLDEAARHGYPLTGPEAIEAIVIAVQCSRQYPTERVLALQERLERSVARTVPPA